MIIRSVSEGSSKSRLEVVVVQVAGRIYSYHIKWDVMLSRGFPGFFGSIEFTRYGIRLELGNIVHGLHDKFVSISTVKFDHFSTHLHSTQLKSKQVDDCSRFFFMYATAAATARVSGDRAEQSLRFITPAAQLGVTGT